MCKSCTGVKTKAELEALGYEFIVTHERFQVNRNKQFIHAAGMMNPAKHWMDQKKNYQQNMSYALSVARRNLEG